MKKKFLWSYEADEQGDWQRYSDLENYIIEDAYQKKLEKSSSLVELGDKIIDFREGLQFSQTETIVKTRQIKREEVSITALSLRDERFHYADNLQIITDIFAQQQTQSIGSCWYYDSSLKPHEHHLSEVIELIVDGITKEGTLLNETYQTQLMGTRLRNVDMKSEEEIYACCVHLYTLNSFLFRLINLSLRNEDRNKIDTRGPYCFILSWGFYNSHIVEENNALTVYCGCTSTDEIIEGYKRAAGARVFWRPFTSTSKNREVAEMFSGNTLFSISLGNCMDGRYRDISSLSQYPEEEEVLLNENTCLQIENVLFNQHNKRCTIMLTDAFEDSISDYTDVFTSSPGPSPPIFCPLTELPN